ncbi:MAG: TVP38/TMEM64 family protein [Deltaproteobacteria bacterium]|nr:TVP38/TMEM64 family protein [Deltaproteobacteria bacterium]MBI3391247.1 TVP38/TMEM64 family protein [Deltaproteobacteria bacterium]
MSTRLIILLLLIAAVIATGVGLRQYITVDNIEYAVRALGPWGPLAFIALYVIGPALFLPGAPLTIAAGVLFGPVWGTVYTIIGATGGAMLAFVVARYLGRDWVERRLSNTSGLLVRIKSGVESEGWKFVAFTRLVPVFPFNILNYALGLTNIGLVPYALASFFCMMPAAAAYVYLGYAGREAAGGGQGLVSKALIALALLAVVAMIPTLLKRLRGAKAP